MPVMTPIITDTKLACAVVGDSKCMNHSAHLHDIATEAIMVSFAVMFTLRYLSSQSDITYTNPRTVLCVTCAETNHLHGYMKIVYAEYLVCTLFLTEKLSGTAYTK